MPVHPTARSEQVLDIICFLGVDNEFRSCDQVGGDPEIPVLGRDAGTPFDSSEVISKSAP